MREIDLDMAWAADLSRSQRQSRPLAGDSRDRWMQEFDKAASPAADAKHRHADGSRLPAQASESTGQMRASPRLLPLIFTADSVPAAVVSVLDGSSAFGAATTGLAPSVSRALVEAEDIRAMTSVAAPDLVNEIAAPEQEAMAPIGELSRTARPAELAPEAEDTPAPAPAVVRKPSGRRLPAMLVPSSAPAATAGAVEAGEDAGLHLSGTGVRTAAERPGWAPPPLNPALRTVAPRAAEPSVVDSPLQEQALRELAPESAEAVEGPPAGSDQGEAVRYFAQSTHFFVDSAGVHAWIRDNRLAPERALAVIRSMAGELAASGMALAGVTVNGKPQPMRASDETGGRGRADEFASHLEPGALREIGPKRDSRDNRDNGGD